MLESLNKESVETKRTPSIPKKRNCKACAKKVAGGKKTTGNTKIDVHVKSAENTATKERGASQRTATVSLHQRKRRQPKWASVPQSISEGLDILGQM